MNMMQRVHDPPPPFAMPPPTAPIVHFKEQEEPEMIAEDDTFSRSEVEELLQQYCDEIDVKMEIFIKEYKCAACEAKPAVATGPSFFSTLLTGMMPVAAMAGAHLLLGVMRPVVAPRVPMQMTQVLRPFPQSSAAVSTSASQLQESSISGGISSSLTSVA